MRVGFTENVRLLLFPIVTPSDVQIGFNWFLFFLQLKLGFKGLLCCYVDMKGMKV